MNVLDIIHYADGYAAAAGNPNDVIQGFYNDKGAVAMTITTAELARIRAAAVGDMLGDSKALDEMGSAATIFRLCRELNMPRMKKQNCKKLPSVFTRH